MTYPFTRAAHIEKVVGERGYAQKVGDNRLKPTDLGRAAVSLVSLSLSVTHITRAILLHFIHARVFAFALASRRRVRRCVV